MRRVLLLLAALACVPLGAALDNGFRADDYQFLTAVRSAPDPGALLGIQHDVAFYRPVALLLFAAEHALFGLRAGLYLLFNALLHGAIALAGFRLLRRLGVEPSAALLAAGLFLVGVAHLDKQVTWACTSGGLLAVLLVLVALLAEADPRRSGAGTAALAALLAPFAHELGLLLVPLLLLRRALGAGPITARPRGWGAALLALGVVPWAVSALLLGSAGADTTAGGLGSPAAVLAAALRYVGYFGLAVLPVPATGGGVPAALSRALLGAQWALGAGVVLACARLLAARTARPGLRFLAGWALLAVLPYAAIPLPARWLELRYLYFAALPLTALAATLLLRLGAPGGWRRGLAAGIAVAMVLGSLGLALVIERRNDAAARSPENLAQRAAMEANAVR